MSKRSKNQAVRAWGVLNETSGDLCGIADKDKSVAQEFANSSFTAMSARVVPVRIIREADYQRLVAHTTAGEE